MQYMEHPEHGAHHFYGDNEVQEAKRNGWRIAVHGSHKPKEPEKPESVGDLSKRKPGRPFKDRS